MLIGAHCRILRHVVDGENFLLREKISGFTIHRFKFSCFARPFLRSYYPILIEYSQHRLWEWPRVLTAFPRLMLLKKVVSYIHARLGTFLLSFCRVYNCNEISSQDPIVHKNEVPAGHSHELSQHSRVMERRSVSEELHVTSQNHCGFNVTLNV